MIDRRDFLKLTGALAAGAGATFSAAGAPRGGPSVIVIGAGFAGLSAARELMSRGISVTVVEAADRVGGRAKTLHGFVDHPIELGCKWVNRGDPFVADYLQTGLLGTIPDKWEVMLAERAASPDRYRRLELAEYKNVWQAFGAVNVAMSQATRGDGATIGGHADDLGLDLRQRRLVDAEIASDAGVLPSGVGAYEWWQEGDGVGTNVYLRDGMSGLVSLLSAGLDIRLGRVVHRIDYNAAGATVHVVGHPPMSARYVLVTVPLGVLKAAPGEPGHIEFNPPLPPQKQAAIRAIPVGTFNKVMMRFRTNFWAGRRVPFDDGRWTFLSLLDDHFGGPTVFADASYGRTAGELGGGAVLHGLVVGEWGRSVAMDDGLVELMVSRLKAVFGRREVEANIEGGGLPAFVMQSWDADPFARGCYSVSAPGTTPHRRNLGRPERGTLFFAGEAVGSDVVGGFRTATIVAALGSGADAAAKIPG